MINTAHLSAEPDQAHRSKAQGGIPKGYVFRSVTLRDLVDWKAHLRKAPRSAT